MRRSLPLLLLLLSTCDWFGSRKEAPAPEKPVQFSEDPAYLAMVRDRMTQERGPWDRYLSAGGNLVREGRRFKAYVFLRQGISIQQMQSVLVLGKTELVPGESPVAATRELEGTVHELHLVRLGPDLDQHLLFTTQGRQVSGYHVITSVYWDVREAPRGRWEFREVWKVSHAYDPTIPESYSPPDFHYWDVDDDGVQEIVVTNPWKGAPPPWRYRWAVFRWHPPYRRLVPLRGLALFPFRDQEPDWLVWSVLEQQRMQQADELVRAFATSPSCDPSPALLQALAYFPGQPEGPPVILDRDERSCRLRADLASAKERMRMQVELVADVSPFTTRWRICRIQLFRLRR